MFENDSINNHLTNKLESIIPHYLTDPWKCGTNHFVKEQSRHQNTDLIAEDFDLHLILQLNVSLFHRVQEETKHEFILF